MFGLQIRPTMHEKHQHGSATATAGPYPGGGGGGESLLVLPEKNTGRLFCKLNTPHPPGGRGNLEEAVTPSASTSGYAPPPPSSSACWGEGVRSTCVWVCVCGGGGGSYRGLR